MDEIRKIVNGYYCELCKYYAISLDVNVSRSLRTMGIVTRTSKSNGLWCYILLPLILLNYTNLYDTSVLYDTVTFISVGLFFHGSLFILFLSLSGNIMLEGDYGGCVACCLISTMLIYTFTNQDLMLSLFITLSSVSSFSSLLKYVLINFPKTFTVGEAMVVVQSIPLFISATTIQYVQSILNGVSDESTFINIIVFMVLITTVLIITSIFMLKPEHRTVRSVATIVTSGAVVLLLKWHIILGRSCLFDIFVYIFMDYMRLKLIMFWLLLLAISILVILMQTRTSAKANTVTRKAFHILASLVFLSGLLTDIPLMTLASGVGFSVLLFVEALRIADIEQVSCRLQSAFVVYCDEKDCGTFAMTPLYLFVGLACPIILVPKPASLELLAGVLAVGVGDTAASCVGATFGRIRWSDSNRTLEGTAFNVLSQVTVVYLLQLFDLLDVPNALTRTLVAAVISALVEAKTDQVDNLVLPLVTILAFQATSFLS